MTLPTTLTWLDGLIIVWLLLALWRAWARGFFAVSLDLAGLVLSAWVAMRWYQPVGAWLTERDYLPRMIAPAIAFFLLWVGAILVITVVGYVLMAQLPETAHRHPLNKILALLPGAINALIMAAIVVTLAVVLPWGRGIETTVRDSWLGNMLLNATTVAEAAFRPVLDDALGELLTFRAIHPESDEQVDLPFEVPNAIPAPRTEAEMLDLVNAARAEAGLTALVADEALREVARSHAADMFARGYFSHISPEGAGPFDRLDQALISYGAAGENLALAPTLQVAHTGLMRSPGHRANILEPQFRRVGIGALDGGLRGIMFVQLFRD